jgi:hypothetical protein
MGDEQELNEEEFRRCLFSDGDRFADWLGNCSNQFQAEVFPHMAMTLEALKIQPGLPIDMTVLVSLWMSGYASARRIQSIAAENGFETMASMFDVGAGILARRLHQVGVGLN